MICSNSSQIAKKWLQNEHCSVVYGIRSKYGTNEEDDRMKEPDKNVLYISDYRMHVTSLMAVALFVYINHKYFTGFFRVFQPPIPIAIDSVTAIGIIAVTDGMLFARSAEHTSCLLRESQSFFSVFFVTFTHGKSSK